MKRIAIAMVAALLAACSDPVPEKPAGPPPDPLRIDAGTELLARLKFGEPRRIDVRDVQRVPGRIEVDETRLARVGSTVAGRVTDLAVSVGQEVRRGQVLATVNSTELSAAQLAYLKALSQRGLAARAAARAQQLLDADVIGAAELQRREAELVQAQAEAGAARDQLKVLGMSEAALDRLSSTRVITSVTQIVSGIAGTVIERKVTEGQVVQPADGVFLVADLSRVWVVADVPEQNAGALRVGDSVHAEIPALGNRRIEGQLSFVSPTVNPETRTVRARMELDNAGREFRPAMLAAVLLRGAPQQQLVVPAQAVVRDADRDHVFVRVAQGELRLRPVVLGLEVDGSRVVQSGLRADEQIVVDGAFHLNNERLRRTQQGL